MKIAVVGTGYVGLVTGVCLAEMGNNVACVDIDADKVKKLKSGKVPIYEPKLDTFFDRNQREGRLAFTTKLEEGVKGAEVIFLALPTPPGNNGAADLSFVLGVAKDLGPLIKNYVVVVSKSTVPVGTVEKIRQLIGKTARNPFEVVSNPEFLREGFAVDDFMKPDRIVVGTQSERAKAVMKELYAPYVRQGNPILFMSERSAELTKYAANSFLATKISFMNEVANLSEQVGANVDEVRVGIGADERIGKRFLFPGVGYGGSCFPKDVRALAKTASQHGYDFKILESVMEVNHKQRQQFTQKIKTYFGGKMNGKTIAIWGLAFKPDTDDIREAPALDIIHDLLKTGARVRATDPEALANTKDYFGKQPRLSFEKNQYKTLEGADALVVVTEWSEYRTPDFDRIKAALTQPVIFDGRNLYDPAKMESLGFYYQSVGRKVVNAS